MLIHLGTLNTFQQIFTPGIHSENMAKEKKKTDKIEIYLVQLFREITFYRESS